MVAGSSPTGPTFSQFSTTYREAYSLTTTDERKIWPHVGEFRNIMQALAEQNAAMQTTMAAQSDEIQNKLSKILDQAPAELLQVPAVSGTTAKKARSGAKKGK